MARILILDDKIDVIDVLSGMLEDQGHEIASEMEPGRVRAKVRDFKPELITLDVSFSEQKDETGIALLQEIRSEYTKAQLPVLVVSGTVNADKLTRMMAAGINGYVGKPVKQEELLKKINDCLESCQAEGGLPGTWEPVMVGESPAILELIVEIEKAARAECSLMITGEVGSGKELVVKKYLELSPRKGKPFVKIDCTNIPQETFESEIFGHEKGAFTGAGDRKIGKVELAQGGVVFFDEIGDLPEIQQQKLLRLLQDKQIERMSSRNLEPICLDVVVLAATHKDLFSLMKQGKFREDLYYRLKYMNVEVPPLREHLKDIPSLVGHFLAKAGPVFHKKVDQFDAGLVEKLQAHDWPGNIRDLEKCIDYGIVQCEGRKLTWDHLAGYFKKEQSKVAAIAREMFDLEMSYENFKGFLDQDRAAKERLYYSHHLTANGFNVAQTAQHLGMARTYLNEIMKRLGIEKPGKHGE